MLTNEFLKENNSIGFFRNLETNNRVVLPTNTHLRLLISAVDVLHSWTIPSFGVKVDACPGRLNQANLFIKRLGVFFGQCSEICWRLDMFNNTEKILNIFIFFIYRFTIANNILLWKLKLKQIGNVKDHVLQNPNVKQLIFIYIRKILKSFYLIEAALTLNWDYNGFPIDLKRSYAQNLVSQIIRLVNRIKDIVYRSTKKKTLIFNAIIKFKLGNPVKIYNFINFFSFVRSLYLNKAFFRQLIYVASGGKIKIKVNLSFWFNPNSCAYRIRQNLLALKLIPDLKIKRLFTTYLDSKNNYIDQSLMTNVKFQLNSKKWITIKQRKLLIQYIKKCQTNLSVLIINKKVITPEIFYIIELLLNSLLFQVYAIEIHSYNKSIGINDNILNNNSKRKLEYLQKLKNFKEKKPDLLKQFYIPSKSGKKYLNIIPCVLDRLIQQLFVLVLDPIIEINSDSHSYGFRKGRNFIMAVGDVQKTLQKNIQGKFAILEPIFVWNANIKKYSDSINSRWLLKNVPLPFKYKNILKSWLKLGHIEFGTIKILANYVIIPQGGIINSLLMNLILNGMETLINKEIMNYQRTVWKKSLKAFSNKSIKLCFSSRLFSENLKKQKVNCRFFRYADDFIVICSSVKLLSSIKKSLSTFLKQRGLKIHLNNSQTVFFNVNKPFNFLGYTFIYLIHSKFTKNKLLHTHKFKFWSSPKLFVYPSEGTIKSLKNCLKTILIKNQNISAYKLITLLNPRIKTWVNYYSFSNAFGVLNLLCNWIYVRIKFWLKRKRPKNSKFWLKKYYFLLKNLLERSRLKENSMIINYTAKKIFMSQIKQNKWNFYGTTWKGWEKDSHKIFKINTLLWPTSIKNIVIASNLVPNSKFLALSYYITRKKWFEEEEKLKRLRSNKEDKLLFKKEKRNKDL